MTTKYPAFCRPHLSPNDSAHPRQWTLALEQAKICRNVVKPRESENCRRVPKRNLHPIARDISNLDPTEFWVPSLPHPSTRRDSYRCGTSRYGCSEARDRFTGITAVNTSKYASNIMKIAIHVPSLSGFLPRISCPHFCEPFSPP